MTQARGGKPIRASEVGEYVFCARAWWLRREGVEPARGADARAAGAAWHTAHGRALTRARRLRAAAVISASLALLLICLLAFLWLRP